MTPEQSAPGWSYTDEMNYLDHVVESHGKELGESGKAIDGIQILKHWLETYDKRRWNTDRIHALRVHAEANLKKLREQLVKHSREAA